MKKRGALKSLVDAKVEEASGNKRLGYQLAAEKIDSLYAEGKAKTRDFSMRHAYEELVGDTVDRNDAVAVAEAVHTSAFPTIVNKVIHRDIIDAYDRLAGPALELVTSQDATNSTSEELVAGFEAGDTEPLLRQQSMAYEETDFGEKHWKIKMADFGRIISLTRETIFEDRTGQVLQRASQIGDAAGHHVQRMIIQTIEGVARTAFKEASFQGAHYKGTALAANVLYSADHSALDGQVNANLVASNALVDYTDIDAVYQKFAAMVNEAGDPVSIVPTTLLVPFALRAKANQIMNSQILGAVGSTDKANIPLANPLISMGNLNILSSVFLSSATSWYMGDFKKQLLKLDVFKPATAVQGASSELAFNNQIISRFRFNMHYGVGHTDWRYIIKSNA